MVLWMLKHRLILQLHTYVVFAPPLLNRKKRSSDDLNRNPVMPMLPEEESLGAVTENAQDIHRASSVSDVASGIYIYLYITQAISHVYFHAII